jgi:hypothetical protein
MPDRKLSELLDMADPAWPQLRRAIDGAWFASPSFRSTPRRPVLTTSPRVRPGALWPLPGRSVARESPATLGMPLLG